MVRNLSQSCISSVADYATERGVVQVVGWDGDVSNERLTSVAVEVIATVNADVHL